MIKAPPHLTITTLGKFEILRHQDPLSGGNWNRRKVCDLFKLLLSTEQHRLHREQIQELLWPSSTSEQAANSFGKTLYLLRRALEPELTTGRGSASTYVALDHDTLMLIPDSMKIDADTFEISVKELQIKLRSQEVMGQGPQGRVELLSEFDRTLTLYGGDYLPDDLYEDWTQRRRDRLRRVYSWLLENAADIAIASRMGLRACEYLLALLEQNVADEPTHRQLMLIYARMGRRSDALNQYQLLREALREELHANPLPETTELFRMIQAGRINVDLVEPLRMVGDGPARDRGNELRPTRMQSPDNKYQEQATQVKLKQEAAQTLEAEPAEIVGSSEPSEPSPEGQVDPERILWAELVGRDEEMRRLQRAYQLARGGQQRIFFVSGEPGIGKTRLAREFTRWAESTAQALVLWGYCHEMSGSLPYQPIADAINAHVRSCSAEQLQRMLGSSAIDLAKIAPDIRAKLPDLPPAEQLGPEAEKRNLYNAVVHYLNTLAAERPFTLILDDMQWADSATMQLLSYLTSQRAVVAQGERAAPLAAPLYVLLYRADEVHEEHPLRGLLATMMRLGSAEEARLKRLSAEAVQKLLVNIAGHEVRPTFTNEIYKYTEGNPFFIGEALIALIQEGKIKKVGSQWKVMVHLDNLALPQSVRLLIERRLVHFSPQRRLTLAVAAVLGRQFSSSLLCNARKLPEEEIAEHIDQAIQLQILTPLSTANGAGEQHYYAQDYDLSFTHDKIREVLSHWPNPLRRRAIHRQVAQAIEVQYAAHLQPYYKMLAYHYQLAEDMQRAVDYYLLAAQQAISLYAFVDAASYMERALALLIGDQDKMRRAEVLRQLGVDVYLYTGRPDKAIEAGIASCTHWRELGDGVKEARASLDVSFAFHWMGRERDAERYIQRALECLDAHPDELRLLAKAHAQWGLAATNTGDVPKALEQLQFAEVLYKRLGDTDPFIAVVTLWAWSWYSFLAASPQQMLDYALQSAQLCRTLGMFAWEPMMTYSVAWAYMILGDMGEGERMARETLAKAQRHNAIGAQGWAYLVLAFLAIQTAEWDKVEQFTDQANTLAIMLRDADLQARVWWSRSVCSGWRNAWQRASEEIAQALQMTEEPSMVYPHFLIQAAKSHLYSGRVEQAQNYLDHAMQLAHDRQYRQLPAIGHRLQGRILQAQGDFIAAQPYFEQSLAELASLNDNVEHARTQEAYGLFYVAQSGLEDREYGQQLIERAQSTFKQLGING